MFMQSPHILIDWKQYLTVCYKGIVRNFPFADVSGGDFWRAVKTGGRRIPGRQPTQMFSWPCRRAQSVLALRRNFWLENWQNKKSAERSTGHDHVARNIPWDERYRFRRVVWNRCLINVLRHVQKCSEDRVKVIQWVAGAWAEVYIAQACRWKGRSLNCPETRWREVEDSLQSGRETTCTTGEACLSKTSTERTTESRRQSYRRPGGEFAATRKKSSYPSDWQTALKWDCASLQPTAWEYFVTLCSL